MGQASPSLLKCRKFKSLIFVERSTVQYCTVFGMSKESNALTWRTITMKVVRLCLCLRERVSENMRFEAEFEILSSSKCLLHVSRRFYLRYSVQYLA